jgi:hypothetical protein
MVADKLRSQIAGHCDGAGTLCRGGVPYDDGSYKAEVQPERGC